MELRVDHAGDVVKKVNIASTHAVGRYAKGTTAACWALARRPPSDNAGQLHDVRSSDGCHGWLHARLLMTARAFTITRAQAAKITAILGLKAARQAACNLR